MAISIANTKNYGQITLNTKPHSDPQEMLSQRCAKMEHLLHTEFMPGEGQVSITHEFRLNHKDHEIKEREKSKLLIRGTKPNW